MPLSAIETSSRNGAPAARLARLVFLAPQCEWLRVSAIAPVLLFPTVASALTVALLSAFLTAWVVQVAAGTFQSPRTPLAVPVGILGVMTVVAVWISPLPDVSLPKAAGVALGYLAFRAVVVSVTNRQVLRRAIMLYLFAGFGAVAGGFTAVAAWVGTDIATLDVLRSFVPHLISNLPGTYRDDGVNPNALGGTTLFFLPLLVILVASRRPAARNTAPDAAAHFDLLPRWIVVLLTFGFGAVLLLSDSKTAWIAFVVTAIGIAMTRLAPRTRAVVLASAGVAVAAGLIATRSVFADALAGRRAVWATAVEAIAHAPWVGYGLNVFRRLVQIAPPAYSQSPIDTVHAHNVFLQVALDVGLPGLAAYLAMFIVALTMCRRIRASGSRADEALALGLAANLAAVHLFGMADAIALGAKVGLFLWLDLGLIAAAYRLAATGPSALSGGERPRTAP